MKAENLIPDEKATEAAREGTLEATLAPTIWSRPQSLSQPSDTATKHLNGMQIADGGGVYIKFTEGRGLSEVGAYVTTNTRDGQLTMMGGIELNGKKDNEYLLGFDYKDIERHQRKDRPERPEHPSNNGSSRPNPRPNPPDGQDPRPNAPERPDVPTRPERPSRPDRPNRPGK
ncbi:hypothetical protein KBI23_21075 [bacterium]|nr:hypothetical protein [bacterium]MBP9807173.1 hypothetical protein [bacterium]